MDFFDMLNKEEVEKILNINENDTNDKKENDIADDEINKEILEG